MATRPEWDDRSGPSRGYPDNERRQRDLLRQDPDDEGRWRDLGWIGMLFPPLLWLLALLAVANLARWLVRILLGIFARLRHP